jgi:hypothetical protein
MNITPEDLQQIALKLGLLGMEKAVLEREKQELTVALEAAETRLEEMGNPSSLVTKDSN